MLARAPVRRADAGEAPDRPFRAETPCPGRTGRAQLCPGRWPQLAELKAYGVPGVGDPLTHRLVQTVDARDAVGRQNRGEHHDRRPRSCDRRYTAQRHGVPAEDAVQQRAPREEDRHKIRPTGQWRVRQGLSAGGQEQRIVRAAAVRSSRGLGHRRGRGVDADDEGIRLRGGADEHGTAIARADIKYHPVGPGDQAGDLPDVHLEVASADHVSHGTAVYTPPVQPPIGPYERRIATVEPWDPRALEVAGAVAELIHERRPDLVVEHIGSTAVPGLPGKGIVDLAIATTADDVPAVAAMLRELGFGPQPGPDPWPPSRPMLVGSLIRAGTTFRIHCHVLPDREELQRDIAFRDALLADPALVEGYAALKTGIVSSGPLEPHQYTYRKQAWISDVHRKLGVERRPITPPATVGILGGGQLGRMIGLAARAMGYRVAILDPDPDCPAASIADRMVVGGYDDVGAALRLAAWSDIVTYELEHVATEVVDAIDVLRPVRPGRLPLHVTQDRIEERRFLETAGVEVAPWREVRTTADLVAAADAIGLPLRLKVATGGYDGRGQLRIGTRAELDDALARLGRPDGERLLVEAELAFQTEVSIVIARSAVGGISTYPLSCNRHDAGILVESVAPAALDPEIPERAAAIGERLAVMMGVSGTLTVELFLMPDQRLIANELAPRVHNSGHWTIEGAATSQFEQHVRAICGLDLGSTQALTPAAVVNVLGTGRARPARLDSLGLARAIADPAVHLHLYDKRQVFERRKMGHVTATGPSTDEALARARVAVDLLRWRDDDDADGERDRPE
jgi:5-(carboxyamino)imidazole ribonucleotide synthase